MFKVLGITGDVDRCECCGKTGLKKTVILGTLDADRNVTGVVYYGANCAAKATKLTRNGKTMEGLAEQVQRESDEAKRNRVVDVNGAEGLAGVLWVVEEFGQNGGTVDRLCFAKGTRSAIKEWARVTYPNALTDVRKATSYPYWVSSVPAVPAAAVAAVAAPVAPPAAPPVAPPAAPPVAPPAAPFFAPPAAGQLRFSFS